MFDELEHVAAEGPELGADVCPIHKLTAAETADTALGAALVRVLDEFHHHLVNLGPLCLVYVLLHAAGFVLGIAVLAVPGEDAHPLAVTQVGFRRGGVTQLALLGVGHLDRRAGSDARGPGGNVVSLRRKRREGRGSVMQIVVVME